MKRIFIFVIALTILPLMAHAMTADEIIEKSNIAYYYAADDSKATAKMYIKDARGRERYREMTILRKDIKDGGEQKYYIFFHEPADVNKMVFMVWKQAEGDDDRWLYLPAIDLVKRIATSDKRSSFAGGVFTYEDVSGRRTSDDTHTLIKEEKLNGKDAYVIKNVPKDADVVEFAHYITWIDKSTFLPIKGEYFNKKGKLYRTIEVEKTTVIDGYPTSIRGTAKNLDTGLTTTIEFVDVKYNVGIKAKVFKERSLRKPPKIVKR